MKKSLKLRAVVSPTPAIIAAAYDENGKADGGQGWRQMEEHSRNSELSPFGRHGRPALSAGLPHE